MPELEPTPIHLTVKRRNTLRIAATLATGGVPQPMTGWTFSAQIRRMVEGELLGEFTIAVVDEAAGRVDLVLTAEQTGELPVGLWWWDVAGTNGTERRTWGEESRVDVQPTTTRPEP